MNFLIIIVSVLMGIGIYNLSCAFVDVPTRKTSKMMLNTRKQNGIKEEKLFDVYVTKIAALIAPLIHIEPIKRNKLVNALNIADIKLTPEAYTMKAYVSAGGISLLAIPFFFLMPVFSFVIIGLAITMGFAAYQTVFDFVKKRKKVIEAELPRFTMTIAQNLENDRDVLRILTSYRRVAGKELGKELDTTIANMKTSNYENALLQFENRIGSTMLSDIVRGLIGTLRGDDQQIYFKMICFDMRQIEQNNLKKEAQKRPKQMQKYSMMMLFCILLIYLVVLSVEVIGSLGVFFD